MRTLNEVLNKFEDSFVSTAIILTCFILFINVATRYFGYSMKWAEEFTRYMIVWITFIGGAMCVRNYAHVGIDALVVRLPFRSQTIVKLIVSLIGIAFSLTMTILGYQLVIQVMSWKQLSPAMMIPMWIPYAGVPIGCLLMTIRYFQVAAKVFEELKSRQGESGCKS